MVTACHQLYFEQGVVIALGYHAIFQDGLLGIGAFATVGVGFVLLLVSHKPVLQGMPLAIVAELFTFHLSLFASYDGPIGLMNLALGKHFVQSCECLRGACEDHETRDRTIQSMHHTQEHFAWLLVLLLDIVFHNIREGAIASLIALNDLPTLFVNDDNMVVLVNDLQYL